MVVGAPLKRNCEGDRLAQGGGRELEGERGEWQSKGSKGTMDDYGWQNSRHIRRWPC